MLKVYRTKMDTQTRKTDAWENVIRIAFASDELKTIQTISFCNIFLERMSLYSIIINTENMPTSGT